MPVSSSLVGEENASLAGSGRLVGRGRSLVDFGSLVGCHTPSLVGCRLITRFQRSSLVGKGDASLAGSVRRVGRGRPHVDFDSLVGSPPPSLVGCRCITIVRRTLLRFLLGD